MNNIAYVRGYTKRIEEKRGYNYLVSLTEKNSEYKLFFDTETTTKLNQNFRVGFSLLFGKDNLLLEQHFFYSPEELTDEEISVIYKSAQKWGIKVYKRDTWIRKVFFKYTLFEKGNCYGFNLPFDLSRVAIDATYPKGKKFHHGFSFKLTNNQSYPRVKVKANGQKYALINFGSSRFNKKPVFRGKFVDLHTISLSLSGKKSISLLNAGKLFDAKILKEETDDHGKKINTSYLKYLVNDVFATHALYVALKEELKKYGLIKNFENIYTSASIGKAMLKNMGVRNFLSLNDNFLPEIIGYVMHSFYGGWSQVTIKQTPTQVNLLDFTSMYPLLNSLLQMKDFLYAKEIKTVEDTRKVQELINKISLEDLQTFNFWEKLNVICEVIPDGYELPIRKRFDNNKQSKNIGICNVTSKEKMWYTLPDLIGSKIRNGKIPKILRAYRFIPKGVQKGLKPVKILGLSLDPQKGNFFVQLVNERQKIKKEMQNISKNSQKYEKLKSLADSIKLLINSTCYGIYCEVNPEDKKSEIQVHSHNSFPSHGIYEAPGLYFNPCMATMITSGARLLLGIIEVLLKRKEKTFAFCDTDSMAVPSDMTKELQNFFKPLNPFTKEIDLLKVEERGVWFYGISAKRYVLYHLHKNKIKIIKYSLHGLGHLLNPFGTSDEHWHKLVWKDILKLHYGFLSDEKFQRKYGDCYAVSKLSISTQEVWSRLKKYNEGKAYSEQIKPFGFINVGFGMQEKDGSIVKPITPYNKNPQEIVHLPFINASTGKSKQGLAYWRNLADTLYDYINHPEAKLDGSVGILKRKSVFIEELQVIGKEVNSLNIEVLKLKQPNEFIPEVENNVHKISSKEARSKGISRAVRNYHKRKKRAGKKTKLYTKTKQKLSRSYILNKKNVRKENLKNGRKRT